ncbi:MAG: hypothetical protein ACI4J6_02100 [Oscillospiraceae bacterium]
MKRCEKCGAEYGDDGLFCPYCDERYGTVKGDNDIVSGIFPEFPPDVSNYAGHIETNAVSFRKEREKIYSRNIRLAAKENYALKKVERRTAEAVKKEAVHKEIRPLTASNVSNGRLKPQNGFNLSKSFMRLGKIQKGILGAAVCIALLAASVGIQMVWDGALADYEEKKQEKVIEGTFGRTIYGKDGSPMILRRLDNNDNWNYTFVYTNTTDEPVFHFAELFSGSDDLENAADMLIIYPSGARGAIEWEDGVPDISEENVYISVLENRQLEIDEWRTIEPGETASGYLYIGGLRKS